MLKYLVKKVMYTGITLFIVLLFIFFLFYLMPGDPITIRFLGKRGSKSLLGEETIQLIKEYYGMDKPLYMQFLLYVVNILTGNWGLSITISPGVSIAAMMWPRLINTLLLCGIATLIGAYLGVRIGVLSAWRRGKASDFALTGVSLILYSVPAFWLGILLLMMFAIWIPLFPLGLAGGEGQDLLAVILDRIHHLILPLVTYVLTNYAGFSLIMRSSLTDVLTEDYMMTAKAKGLSQKGIHKEHAMPNAMLPMITVIAYEFGWVLLGAIVIETVFSYPGIGLLTYDAVVARDFPVLMVLFFIMSAGMVIANAIADVLYSHFDPRVKM